MSATTSQHARASTAMSWIALTMAGVSALILGVANAIWFGVPSSDGIGISILFMVGWAVLAGAVILAIGVLARLVWKVARRRRPTVLELVLLAATILLIGIAFAHPLVGSGSGNAVG